MAAAVKTRADCNDKQLLFLAALESHDATLIPRKDRWRWCAEQAGYPNTVPLADIMGPINPLIKEVAENILLRASVEAAWTLAEAAGDGLIDAQTKDRISAAKDVLDRSVPKKEADNRNQTPAVALLVLPAKQESIKLVEAKFEDVPTIQEG
jgi:hypothetical protein